ncbi:MAG: ComEC/Rec2 family competence protein, partial [Alphaproteobacteria bacterium]|nr:ComEC/Rec2 family competence protein [Alphaproteobacteria bacterium]
TAIITGEKSGMSKELMNAYRDSGMAHFLSISGLHMSMVAGLMFFLVRLIMAAVPSLCIKYDSKKIAVYFAIGVSIFYLFISGGEVPAQRAFIMTFIIVIGVLFNRRAISMNTISWAALIILIITPEALIGASFQMSFSAVVILIAFYEKISKKIAPWFNGDKDNIPIRFLKVLVLYLLGIIVADILASLATLPFAIYHFNRIAIYTSLANLLAGPVIGFIIMPAILLALLMLPFSGFGFDVAIKIAGYGINLINQITLWVSSFEGASLQVPSIPLWGLVLIVFGGLWLCIWEQKWRFWGVVIIFLGLTSVFFVRSPDAVISEDLKVIALKSEENKMIILPCRGKKFIKELWYEKTASQPLNKKKYEKIKKIYNGKNIHPDIIQLKCNKETCIYKNRIKIVKGKDIYVDGQKIDLKNSGGISVYLSSVVKIEKVRDYIGNRIWNN